MHDTANTSQRNPARRRARILEPIVLISMAALAVLTLVTLVLLNEFNTVTLEQQKHAIEQAFQARLDEAGDAVTSRLASADAARHLSPRPDSAWLAHDLAPRLKAEAGIDSLFLVGPAGHPVSAALAAPGLAGVAAILTAQLSHPRDPRATAQASTLVRVRGEPVYVIATSLPGTDRSSSPVVIATLPISAALLSRLGAQLQLPDLALALPGQMRHAATAIPLRDTQGETIAALLWTPSLPQSTLLRQLLAPMVLIVLVFMGISWRMVRRSSAIANDLIASEAQARHLAFHDILTQLPNRALAFDRLRQMLAAARRSQAQIGVMCLDLDRFKDVNDTLGHPSGDELIQQVAGRLCKVCRESDTVARMGGDEFLVIQPNSSAAGASHLAERILASLKEPYDLEYGQVEIGCSVGVTVITNPEIDPPEALRQADLALYASKENGRSRVTFFEPDMDAALKMRRSLETDLRKALAEGTLSMAYQPQTDEAGAVHSVEALVRWNHPEKGSIAPTVFVPLAEESGLILDLGEFVFRRVLEETRAWKHLRVAINVSALQLRSQSFMAMLTRLVAEFRIDASRYEIEITESALLGDDRVTRDNVTVLKQEGFTIALDDFGTGYSSLSSLQRFKVDKIKIDRSFVRNLEADDRDAEALVDAIVKLGRALRLEIIAEGVETARQRERLVQCGCTQFQGYLLGKPVGASELLAVVA